jgi:SAM-dependent methyltransferase
VEQRSGSIAFDRVAGEYDRTRGGVARGAAAAAAVLPLLADADPVLELGVGTGLVATALAAGGRQVAGADLSLPMLRQAADRLPGRVVAGDAGRLPVRSGSVAAVVFIHVLHLVGDLAATLSETARVLRAGGRAVASVRPPDLSPETDVAEILWGLARRLGRAELRPDNPAAVAAAAERAGLTPAGRGGYRPGLAGLSPAEAVDRIGSRSASWMWHVDDERWAGATGPAVDALRGLPDQDRRRTETTELPLLVFAKPD